MSVFQKDKLVYFYSFKFLYFIPLCYIFLEVASTNIKWFISKPSRNVLKLFFLVVVRCQAIPKFSVIVILLNYSASNTSFPGKLLE